MKDFQNKKKLQIVLLVLIAVLTLGIGYASITAVNLIINGNATASVDQNNFKVYFVTSSITTGTGTASIDEDDNTIAYFDITGLSKEGDTAVATYTVLNNSNSIGADISLQLTNSNSEYFKVTETVADIQLQAGDDTTATVTVEMIKTPIDSDVTTSVSAKLIASPTDNNSATGKNAAEIIKPSPNYFATDSWTTIKSNISNNNADRYNIGDTKIVTVNGNDYTVRVANKSIDQKCGSEDFSETACGFVVEFVDIITIMPLRSSGNSNLGGYASTDLYYYLNNTLPELLPDDLQGIISPTRVISGYGCIDGRDSTLWTCTNPDNNGNTYVTLDKLYLLSTAEVFDYEVEYYKYDTAASKTSQLDFYRINGQETIQEECSWYPGCTTTYAYQIGARKRYNNERNYWWLRTPYYIYDFDFNSVSANGTQNGGTGSPNIRGIAPAFRIG